MCPNQANPKSRDNAFRAEKENRKYIKKVLPIVEYILDKKLGKQSTPNMVDWRPAEYDSPLIDEAMRNKYQKLVGIVTVDDVIDVI